MEQSGNALVDHLPTLLADARKLCACTADAEDLVQETMARAAAALDSFHAQKNRRGWFFMVMRGALADQRRKERRRRITAEQWLHMLPDTVGDAADRCENDSERIRWAVESLNDQLRTTMLLRLQQRSLHEIGAAMGIPAKTVGTRIMRAKKKMRKALEAQEVETLPTS